MKTKSIFTKSAALIMAAVLGITAAGCGIKGQSDNEDTVSNETGTDISITEDTPEAERRDDAGSNGMGRYVEQTVYEGDYWDKVSTQTLNDGQIVFVNSMTSRKFVSKDSGSTWEAGQNEEFAAFIKKHYPISTAVSKDGVLALVCMDKKDETSDGAEYIYNLYIYNTDNTSKQIPIDLPDADSSLSEVAFDEHGSLYAYAAGCRSIYKVDINEGTSEMLTDLQENCDLIECKNNILMCMAFEKIFLYDLGKKSFIEDEALDSFTQENYSQMAWTGGGYTAYAFLGEDNIIYVAGNKGLYRHVIGGSVIEQVIDGNLSSLGAPSNDILAMVMNDKNEFLTAYNNGKIVKFTYDAAASAVPNDRITVYSLNESDLVRQTISAYQTEYPDMFIEYQIGMDEDGVTREDALKKLNTLLLSGSGPDILMLDGINIDTYAEKGVLMDLSDIINEVNQNDGLYMNLIENMQKDGKMYAVPAHFCIPAVGGRKDLVDSIRDYQSFADAAESAREEYPDTDLLYLYSAKQVMKRFMPVCAPAWRDSSGKLDTQEIKAFLEQSKRIYDIQMNGTPQGIITSRLQNMADDDESKSPYAKYRRGLKPSNYLTKESPLIHGEIIDSHSYREMLSLQRTKGFEDTAFKLFSGQSGNVYRPVSIVGVNAATNNPDVAKQFVRMMFGTTVLDVLEFGLPMNKKALAEKFAYDENMLDENGGQYSESFVNQDGESFGYTIYPVEQDGIDNLEKWIAGLDTPYLGDTVLENAVYTEGAAYIEGRQDIEKTIKAISDSVEIYLYE